MTIERVIVKNYRALRAADVRLDPALNIIVGDNEAGKSTLLEAINLALRCQLNRRPALQELHPLLVNAASVAQFIGDLKVGKNPSPPEILIELYLTDKLEFADLKGTNNSERADLPGITLSVGLDPDFREEYQEYVADPSQVSAIPIEYYRIVWQGFSGNPVSARSLPLRVATIDPSAISNTYAANKYVLEIVRDHLTNKQKVDLALSYRKLHDVFLLDDSVAAINQHLAGKAGQVSDRRLSMAMDTTTRASWETGVLPHLDNIPLTLAGKGEQSSIKIKLAIESESDCHLLLIEEPENHLSHANLNKLISHIGSKCKDRQLIITTHSSFVLNKLGVDHIRMFNGATATTLNDLPPETKNYFMKLPGHDTLRMVLSKRSILVEGPSDELIIQKAYWQVHGRMPLEDGIEVISVNSLAFKRFLDIASILEIDVRVVTDNDGNPDAVSAKYADYSAIQNILICVDKDKAYPTLEPQLLKANGRERLNLLLDMKFEDDTSLLAHMSANKAASALKIFESAHEFSIPDYIRNAIG
jgi:putative ATP-dependent endonuclease of OLD family